MQRAKNFFLVFICLWTFGFVTGQSHSKQTDKNSTFHVLFVGNSLTYTNNLPKLVRGKAKQKGFKIKTQSLAYPNYALMDHWNDGDLQKKIESRKYDFVIVQQGPSSQAFGKKILLEYGNKLSELCEDNGTKLAYFMVWPSLNHYSTFESVINNYQEAAIENGSILCPVGEVWKEHFDTTDNFDYYGPDGFHPSQKGSEVAAEVIVKYLFL